jgi:hypothetical protein
VAVGAVVLAALAGCGGGGGSTHDEAAAAQPKAHAQADAAPSRCQGEIGGFLKAMAALRSNLAVGLSYEQYAAEMRGVRAAYRQIPVDRLTLGCLAASGTPGEKALNQYIDAANAWGECLAEAACDTASIEPGLQRKWRVASHFLSEAQSAPGA